MDQAKIGSFLKELRNEKGLTQEQLAEKFHVAARTVSRWENGNNLPDLSILVELADFYGVDIRELIDGERKSEKVTEEMKDTLEKVADYSEEEKTKILKSLYGSVIVSAILFIAMYTIPFVIDVQSADIFTRYSNVRKSMYVISVLGIMAAVTGVVRIMQYVGNMSKERLKKIRRVLLPISILIMVLSIVAVLALVGAMLH